MWCGLCGAGCEPKLSARSSTAPLPRSGRSACELLTEAGQAVMEGALICLDCMTHVFELDWLLTRAVSARQSIEERALLKASRGAQHEAHTPREEEDTTDEPTQTAAATDEPPGGEPPEGGPAASGKAPAQARPRSRRAPRRRAKASSEQPGPENGERDPTTGQRLDSETALAAGGGVERVSGPTGGGNGDAGSEVGPVDPSDAENGSELGGPVNAGGGGDTNDDSGVNFSEAAGPAEEETTGTESERAAESVNPNHDRVKHKNDRAGSRRRRSENGRPGAKRPDWNERWRIKALKDTSRHDLLWSDQLSQYKQALLAAEQLEQSENSEPLAVGSTTRVKAEPGTERSGGSCSSGTSAARDPDQNPSARPPGDMFRMGRKMVKKQPDGSATPAVKMMQKDSHGKTKVAFLDHYTALRRAARLDRVHEITQAPPEADQPAAEAERPAKRQRRPRVMTKPPAAGPPVLPSEVGWMAPGQTWLPTEGAVHSVLDVQPGEGWVDAIVRAEAAQDWPDGENPPMSAPLANVKSEPPE